MQDTAIYNYGCCDFVLGSTAEIERLWSIVLMHLHGSRNRTTPLMMEAMVFLRVNREFLGNMDIFEAYHSARDSNLNLELQKWLSKMKFALNLINFNDIVIS